MSEQDLTEPREEDLAPKPDVEELPEDGIDVSDVEPEDVPEEDFLPPEKAAADDTVDDSEHDEPSDPS